MNMPFNLEKATDHNDIVKFCDMVFPAKLFDDEVSSDKTYADDHELYADYGRLHLLTEQVTETRRKYFNSLGTNELPLNVTIDEKRRLIEYLESTAETYRKKIKSRIAATATVGSGSTFLSLVNKLELSEKEREAFVYMINMLVGNEYQTSQGLELNGLRVICGMTFSEIMDFLDNKRIHMVQNLIDVEDGVGISILKMQFRLSEELMMFLLKEDEWSAEETDGLVGTVMYEVLSDAGVVEKLIELETNLSTDSADNLSPSIAKSDFTADQVKDFDLHEFLASEQKNGGPEIVSQKSDKLEQQNQTPFSPYLDDQEYLEDYFSYFTARIELKEQEEKDDSYSFGNENKKVDKIRLAKNNLQKAKTKVQKRLEVTRKTTTWIPRLEAIAEKRNLDTFEKEVILALAGTTFIDAIHKGVTGGYRFGSRNSVEVGNVLDFFADSFRNRLQMRKYFYRDSKLVAEGMINVSGEFSSDILDYKIGLDRKMLDYIAGLDTEISNIVDGGNIYFPKVKLDNVIMPAAMKQEIVELVENSHEVEKIVKKHDKNNTYSGGHGTVLLFYGEPGTGKTMMANALANHLCKKILLINFPSLGELHGDKVLNFFLRLAKVSGAIPFFDECDAAFQSRDSGSKNVNVLLSAIERFTGLIIMATNRPYDIDKAMESRMGYRFEFKVPDMHRREIIWQEHLLPGLNYSDDIHLRDLAVRYDFSGRSIKNAVLAGISYGLSRKAETLQITMADLERGAKMQLQGHLRRANLERSIAPSHGLERLILPKNTKDALQDIVSFEKAKPILQSEWGFSSVANYGYGNSVLFYGPPGTGKTMAAEAIGYEVGSPVMVVNLAELQSKYVGETAKNIDAVFKEAKNNNCILVFDDAEGLFGTRTTNSSSTDKHTNMDSSILLERLERFSGVVILTTNLPDMMDSAFKDRLKFKVEFKMPDTAMREKIWQYHVPLQIPGAGDIDFDLLAKRFEFNGRTIKNCIVKAVVKAVVREEVERRLTLSDLLAVAEHDSSSEKVRTIGF